LEDIIKIKADCDAVSWTELIWHNVHSTVFVQLLNCGGSVEKFDCRLLLYWLCWWFRSVCYQN